MSRQKLNKRQRSLLWRIANGVRPVTSGEYALATTVYALRNRGLVATRREGGIWTAAITDAGRCYLEHGRQPADAQGPAPDRPKRTIARADQNQKRPAISADDLIVRLEAAGGSLRIPDPEAPVRAAWRHAIHAAAHSGRLPAGMRLWHTGRDRGDLVVRLVPQRALRAKTSRDDTPTISVPERLTRPHPIVAKLRELSATRASVDRFGRPVSAGRDQLRRLEVSRQNRSRALRIMQALLTEAEARG